MPAGLERMRRPIRRPHWQEQDLEKLGLHAKQAVGVSVITSHAAWLTASHFAHRTPRVTCVFPFYRRRRPAAAAAHVSR